MKNTPFTVLLAVAALSAMSCGTNKVAKPAEAVSIAYGGAAGSAGTWALEQVFKGKIMSGGMPQLMVIKAHAALTETVEESGENGWKKVRLATKMSPLEVNGMVMELGALPPVMETVAMRSPAGDVKELEKAHEGRDVLAWVARSLGSTFPILPPAPVLPGERWERRSEVAAPFGGVFESVTIGVFEGTEDIGGIRCARLRMEGGVDLKGSPKGADIEFFRLEYKGVVHFDVVAGRVIDSIQNGSINVRARMGKLPVEALMLFDSTLKPAGANQGSRPGPTGADQGSRPGSAGAE